MFIYDAGDVFGLLLLLLIIALFLFAYVVGNVLKAWGWLKSSWKKMWGDHE